MVRKQAAVSAIPPIDETLITAFNLIQSFQEGTVETLRIQCNCEIKSLPYYIREDQSEMSADVAGVIGMTSSQFVGAIAITFSKATYLEVMGKMFGEEFQAITQDIEDGAGELLNIIFGHAKAKLNNNGHDIERAIPSVVQGETFEMQNLTPTPSIVMPFQTEKGTFEIEIGLSR